MTVHVGEVISQVDIQPPAAATSPPATDGATLAPSWAERERHRRLAEDERRARERVAGDRFDG